jgi:hypothetical protein
VSTVPEAVAEMYRAFAGVPAPASLPYCDHCVTGEHIAALLGYRPVSAVPARLLRPYLANLVVDTVGSPADARYFAPRALELLVTGELTWPELPAVARYLASTLDTWTAGERASVAGLLDAAWRERIGADAGSFAQPDAAGILHAAGYLVGDVAPLLDLGLAELWRHGAGHLVLLLDRAAHREADRWCLDGHWAPGAAERVEAWLRAPALRDSIEERFEAEPGDDDATVLWASLVAG